MLWLNGKQIGAGEPVMKIVDTEVETLGYRIIYCVEFDPETMTEFHGQED